MFIRTIKEFNRHYKKLISVRIVVIALSRRPLFRWMSVAITQIVGCSLLGVCCFL